MHITWERSGSVVECLTPDREVAGSSLTRVTALCSLKLVALFYYCIVYMCNMLYAQLGPINEIINYSILHKLWK